MINIKKFTIPYNKILCSTLYLILTVLARLSIGGTCWRNISSDKNLCQKAFRLNITQDECCGINGPPSVSWSPHEIISDIFYWNFIANGANMCHRCHEKCSSVECGKDKTCRLVNGLPVCVCKPPCDKILKLRGALCGTDGKRYRNYCALQRYNCQKERQVKVEYYGKCRNSCKRVQCESGNHCLQDQNGVPHCIPCNDHCNMVLPDNPASYMCAENGKTYRNTCELRADICKTGRSIRISHYGKCFEKETCSSVRCPYKTTCLISNLNNKPVCMNCVMQCAHTAVSSPVCGTDKKTYSSYCHMVLAGCRSGVFLSTRHRGTCRRQVISTKDKNSLKVSRKANLKQKRLAHRRRKRRHNKNTKHQKSRDLKLPSVVSTLNGQSGQIVNASFQEKENMS